jgi:hypothetical protein
MGRIKANDGQELVYGDINKIAALTERELYDRFLHEMLGRQDAAFFGDSFRVSRTGALALEVAPGMGLQYDAAQVSPEPQRRPMYRSAAVALVVSAAHATLNRIDIVCVRANRAVTATESRRYKSTVSATPTTQSFDIETDWQADVAITAGTPDASPAAPATPAGYVKVAEVLVTAVTGVAASGAITDMRTCHKRLGGYDAIVGATSDCTDADLASAIARVSAGAKILIASNLALTSGVSLNKANLQIEALPGVTLSGGAITALTLAAAGCRIKGLRFSGFATAISISDTFNHHFITECRFSGCTNEITDNNATPNSVSFAHITE